MHLINIYIMISPNYQINSSQKKAYSNQYSKKQKKKLFSLSIDSDGNEIDEYDDKNSMNSLMNKFYTKVEDLPWQILELNDSQYYHLKYKYYKHMFIIVLNTFLFLIMLIKLNIY